MMKNILFLLGYLIGIIILSFVLQYHSLHM